MLLVGAFVYGFGNWEAIQKDPKLGLQGKFFLEEGKKGEESTKPIPNAIHLVRRGDFLLNLLREHQEKLASYESSLRTKSIKQSVTPPPQQHPHMSNGNGVKRRAESEAVSAADDGASSAKRRKRRPTPTFTDSESSDEWCVTRIVILCYC